MDFKISILALGKAGANIAQSFDDYVSQVYYINSHRDEMELLEGDFYDEGVDYNMDTYNNPVKLCIDGAGTGRSPAVGNRFAEHHRASIEDFLRYSFEGHDKMVLVFVGGGGGTGTGFAPTVCEILSELGVKFGIVYTMPLKQEGSPTIPNAINGLNTLVKSLKGKRVAPFFIVDNQMIYDEYERSGNYWEAINERISQILLFTRLFDNGASDLSTFNTLDEREFVRIFRLVRSGAIGFNDIKKFTIDLNDVKTSFNEGLKETNMSTVKGYDYRSSEGLLVVVEKPDEMTDQQSEKLDEFFTLVSNKYRGKRMLKSVVNGEGKDFVCNILFSGLDAPKYLERIQKDANKLIETGKKRKEAKVSVSGVKFQDDFVDY